jgi:hypothetical protein
MMGGRAYSALLAVRKSRLVAKGRIAIEHVQICRRPGVVIWRTIHEFASEGSQWNAASSAGGDNVAANDFDAVRLVTISGEKFAKLVQVRVAGLATLDCIDFHVQPGMWRRQDIQKLRLPEAGEFDGFGR